MKESFKVGISFGLTSGVITTMGLMVGLYAGTQSFQAVVGGVLTIAIADSFSDALGMHLHEESENEHTPQEIWESTLATFVSKLFFSSTFLFPIFLLKLNQAMIVSVVWGLTLVTVLSYLIARQQKEHPLKIILEHVLIAIAVIVITHFVGLYIYKMFH